MSECALMLCEDHWFVVILFDDVFVLFECFLHSMVDIMNFLIYFLFPVSQVALSKKNNHIPLSSMMNITPDKCCVFGRGQFESLPPIICIEFILGMIGNGVALWIFCFCLKPWKSSTVFLFNLALADFLLNVILPFRASYYLMGRDWIFGDVFCRISLFMLAMNRCGSILFLTAVAVDRFLRVVHPHHPLNSMSVRKTVGAACAIWALTISQTAHLMFNNHITPSGNLTQCESFQICNSSNHLSWHKFIFVFSFYLPLAIILFCTIRIITQLKSRQMDKDQRIRKTLHFIVVVVVVFFLCFFPSNLTQVVIWIKVTFYPGPCEEYDVLQTVFFYTISLTYLNSTLDPIVYYFYSPTFKKICKKQLKRLWKKAEVPAEEDQTRDTGSQTLTQL